MKDKSKNIVAKYLEDKNYNILFERLLYAMYSSTSLGDVVIPFDFSDEYANAAMELMGNFAEGCVYNYSNELLDSVFEDLDLCDGRALVVGSSGDQVLHCVLAGAKNITLIDGNMWTKPFVELKLAAIKNLSFQEFGEYFTKGRVFDHKYYSKVSHDLSKQSQAFWDSALLDLPDQDVQSASYNFLHYNMGGDYYDAGREYHSYYNSEEMYNKLKNLLCDCSINIEIADCRDFPTLADGQYDLIMLSNIYDYIREPSYFGVIRSLAMNNLTPNGKMQVYYGLTNRRNQEEFETLLKRFLSEPASKDLKLEKQGVKADNGFINMFKNRGSTNFVLRRTNITTASFDEMGNYK